MKAYFEIENFKTNKVITIMMPVIVFSESKIIKTDISHLSKSKKELLMNAISKEKEFNYIDIEAFYIDEVTSPNFGDNYSFFINDGELIGISS